MRMIAATVALTLSVTTAARADFVVNNAAPTNGTSQATVTPPATLPPQPPSQTDEDASDRPAPSPPRFKMAYGFGNEVPLSFACRQIVPNAVRVTYGPGASPSQLVSWKGGDTWNHVLRDAVKPIGLQLVMTHMAVEIRR